MQRTAKRGTRRGEGARAAPTSKRRLATKLPRLTRDRSTWVGTAILSTWTGFQARLGPYGSASPRTKRPRARLSFNACESGGGQILPPSAAQRAAYAYLLAHESAVTAAILARVLRAYPKLRATYHKDYDIDPNEKPEYADELDELFDDHKPLPVIRHAKDLRKVMGLAWIHVLDVEKAGVAYVGFELGCSWDDEHGAGLMMHKKRVVDFGSADTSFLEWIAEKDGGTHSEQEAHPPRRRER